MSEHGDRRPFDERELVRLAGATPVTAPSADARERARRAFLTGRDDVLPIEEARRRPGPAAFVPLALAASLLAVVVWGLQPEERWTVLETTGSEGARLSSAPAEVGAEFDGGVAATRADSELDVQLGGTLRVLLNSESRAVLPRGPGRWLGKSRRLTVEEGEIFGTTQGQSLGFELTLVTPEAEARILGTTFAVTRNEHGPCFCLYDGEIEVTPRDSDPVHVPMKMRIQVYADGSRAPEIVDLTEMERTKLRMIQEAGIVARSNR
jgi:ferric-dicitrate binding protein FerR (iron transport regulator)